MNAHPQDDGRRADPWFIAYSKPRAELSSAQELRDLGVDAYCPAETVWRRHARTKTAVLRPLFPRYLFVEQPVRVDGIDSFLSACGRPLELPYAYIADLRAAETMGLFDRTVERKITFNPGQPVRIIGGPFTGFMAEVMASTNGEGRVRVLLKGAFGGMVSVKADKLEAA